MNVGIVASTNGLGHARRVLNLASGFRESSRDLQIKLFVSKRQIDLLDLELQELIRQGNIRVVVIHQFGIDGWPATGIGPLSDVPLEIRREINKVDVVISDNSLWPARFNDNFFLMGHFDWISYARLMETQGSSNEILEQVSREEELFGKVRKWFRTTEFYLESPLSQIAIDIPLFKYGSDKNFAREREGKGWISNGTTGRNESRYLDELSQSALLEKRETWEMGKSNRLPKFVIGRPGLGTIRDCLASSTCFIPLWTGKDVELRNNTRLLVSRKLTPSESISQIPKLFELDFEKYSRRIVNYWLKHSSTPRQIASTILFEIGYS